MGQRYYYYFVMQVVCDGERSLYLNKRTARDIWRNLYDFPSIKTTTALKYPLDSIAEAQKANLFRKLSFSIGTPSAVYRQQLTHLKVSAWFIPVFLQEPFNKEMKNSLSLVHHKQLINIPVPRLIARYLQDQNIIK
ncbi:hypothetical protein MNBD_BACTEROID07-1942 [hydrothermal vent metagenome]|uniref:Uncharacterized protein n=1 Tax=hydrothermal vent metagenome TaxID=652676 RepID=A0A3B0UTJ3_9ZZZZ